MGQGSEYCGANIRGYYFLDECEVYHSCSTPGSDAMTSGSGTPLCRNESGSETPGGYTTESAPESPPDEARGSESDLEQSAFSFSNLSINNQERLLSPNIRKVRLLTHEITKVSLLSPKITKVKLLFIKITKVHSKTTRLI